MRTVLFFLLPLAAVADDPMPAGDQLRAQAAPALIALQPVAESSQYFQLPELVFDVRIEARCGGGSRVRSVLVSVADTRLWHSGDEFLDSGTVQTSLVVPRPQAGILRVDGFCRAGIPGEESRRAVDGVFTARLSMRCAGGDNEAVAYLSLPLDVVLECRDGDTPGQIPQPPNAL